MCTNIKLVWRLQMIKYCFPFRFLPVFTFNCDSFIIITICRDSCNTARSNSICLWGICVPCSIGNLLNTNEGINWFMLAGTLMLLMYVGDYRLEHLHANFIKVQDIPWILQKDRRVWFIPRKACSVVVYWSTEAFLSLNQVTMMWHYSSSHLWYFSVLMDLWKQLWI